MRLRTVAPYAALSAGLAVVLPVARPVPHLGDLFLLWGVGRMAIEGLSPYERASWQMLADRYPDEVVGGAVNVIPNMVHLPGPIWPYPPWTAYALAPFGALPPGIGTELLSLSYLLVGIAAAIVLARLVPGDRSPLYGVALVSFALFQPFAMGVRAGQFAAFLLLGVALVTDGLLRDRTLGIVAGALLLFLKPHLFALLAIVVLVALVRRRRWRAVAVTSGALLAVAGASLALRPESVAAVLAGVADRTAGAERFATTWALVRALDPRGDVTAIGWMVAAAAAAAAIGAALRMPVALRMPALLAATLAASLALSPYVQSYDDLLLLPTAFVALAATGMTVARPARAALLAVTVVIAVVYPWSAIVLQMTSGTQASSGALPLLFALLLAVSAAAVTVVRGPRAALG